MNGGDEFIGRSVLVRQDVMGEQSRRDKCSPLVLNDEESVSVRVERGVLPRVPRTIGWRGAEVTAMPAQRMVREELVRQFGSDEAIDDSRRGGTFA